MMDLTPYQALVESALRLTALDGLDRVNTGDLSAVPDLLRQNRLAIESARRVLGPHCVVPVRFEKSFFDEHSSHHSPLRKLALTLNAEALLAASNQDFRKAAEIGVDMLELGNAVRRGGLVVALLVEIAISQTAIECLRKIRKKFDRGTRRLLIYELQRLESQREPIARIVSRDAQWEVAVGWHDEHHPVRLHGLTDSAERKTIALMRLLALDLALRDSHSLSGAYPSSLSDMPPQTLVDIPLDPFTDQAFLYRPLDDGTFQLYSSGPKMFDGGGKFGPCFAAASGTDLCLDANDYSPACSSES